MKIKLEVIVLTFFLLTILSSCDCLQHVSGTVIDKDTKQPIDSVYVLNSTGTSLAYTDIKGNFSMAERNVGLCGCPPMFICFNKIGYEESKTKIRNSKHTTIYLTKKK